jgi:DNA (cytosine-5)-methyltransferase 1
MMEKSFKNAHNSEFRDNLLTFADFYAGIGGFRLGLEKLGWHCVFSNENNRDCVATYNSNFRDSIEPHDIEDFPLEKIPDFDVFCGGFPCQPFSRAGKKMVSKIVVVERSIPLLKFVISNNRKLFF